jgi:hypothetical protein
MEEKPEIKKPLSFKEKYQDPEFKKKHNEYVNEKVKCSCGRMVKRVAMAKHKRTKVHQRLVQEAQENPVIEDLVEKLVREKLRQLIRDSS